MNYFNHLSTNLPNPYGGFPESLPGIFRILTVDLPNGYRWYPLSLNIHLSPPAISSPHLPQPSPHSGIVWTSISCLSIPFSSFPMPSSAADEFDILNLTSGERPIRDNPRLS